MKAIIYCRKSTDRGDRQQLSIEAQLIEAERIAKKYWLEVIKIFKETMTAKEPWRPLFNEMMKLFSKNKADCIITWKLNRLARNPIDEWTIKWSLQNGTIKAIYTEGEVFKAGDNVLIMWMHFWMSTQYILDLQKDIKRGIRKKIANGGVCQKAPLGYLNNKLNKTIEIDKQNYKWVIEIFNLRAKNTTYKNISELLYNKWLKNKKWEPISKTTIESIIKNKFYIGLVKHNWEYYKWDYKLFISKNLFLKAQVWTGCYIKKEWGENYLLKWFIKDNQKNFLFSWYRKKWNIYYKSSSRIEENINISENLIFDKFWDILKDFSLSKEFIELNKEIILEVVRNNSNNNLKELNKIESNIKVLEDKKDKLLDLRLEWEIEREFYNKKINAINLEIQSLENLKENFKNNDKNQVKINFMSELIESLCLSYKRASKNKKSVILKNLISELFVNSKKELSYAENSLLNLLKMFNFSLKNNMEVPSGIEPL